MDIVSKLLKLFFGTKSDKDRKAVEPYVQKVLAVYPSIDALSHDALRERSAALRQQIRDFIQADEDRIAYLKEILEKPETSLEDKERHSKEIDDKTKLIDEKIEQYIADIVFATRFPDRYGMRDMKDSKIL